MGSITTGIGLISGIDTATLIDNLIALESTGKVRLQQRIAVLKSQQTALLDINARLLNLKTASRAFRIDDLFQSALATSSNEDVLTATASAGAAAGTYAFTVKQLVSTSQVLSRGFADRETTPLGLDSISFELGNGRVTTDVALEDLNGGLGVARGYITIEDSLDVEATVDLTDVSSLQEVLDRINAAAVDVTATIDGDHIVVTDNAGGGGPLIIADGDGDTTATDLGIAGTAPGGTITGSDINFIGSGTALRTLRDGTGVLVRDNVADLQITARDGTAFDVDLGRINEDIADATLLTALNDGAGVSIDADPDTMDIRFVARDGSEYEVDLTGVTTVGGLRTRISAGTSGHVTLEVDSTGDRFKVVDTVGGAGNLQIHGTDDVGTDVAEELGILNESGAAADEYVGEIIPSTVDQAQVATIQEVIDRINDATGNAGRVQAQIGADGVSLTIVDLTGQTTSNLIVASTTGNPDAAAQLGIEGSVAAATLTGDRLIAGLNSVLVSSLNGGSGLGGATQLSFTDRDATAFSVASLSSYESLSDLVTAINTASTSAGAGITVSINDTGNGLLVTDDSVGAGNLIVTNNLGLDIFGIETAPAGVAASEIRGRNLQHQYVSTATRLDDLNYGRGIATGVFRIMDGLGETADVNIGGSETTVYDIIQEINSRGLAVLARVNDNGDGIIIEEDATALGGETPFVKIKVTAVSGTTAADLNLLGESEDVEGGFIDGSYEHVIDVSASDSIDDVVAAIAASGAPVRASVLNTMSGASPYRLSLVSSISGRAGDLVIDTGSVDLGLSVLERGDDAKVFFGASNPEDAFLLRSSTNSLDGVLEGVTIDLHQADDDPVTLTVATDLEAIVAGVERFVTNFNDVVGRIGEYDFYDTESEERGVLLGDPTVGNVRASLYRIASGRALNVGTSFSYLSQVGIRFNNEGEMTFDRARFEEALASDPAAVEALFATYDVSESPDDEIAPGVTVPATDAITVNALGFGDLFDRLLDDLTTTVGGLMTRADDSFQSQIDLATDRVTLMDERLDRRRERLTAQFAALESTLARLQSQSNSLLSLQSNVALASARLSSRSR